MSAKYSVGSKPGGFFWTLLLVQPELVMRNFYDDFYFQKKY